MSAPPTEDPLWTETAKAQAAAKQLVKALSSDARAAVFGIGEAVKTLEQLVALHPGDNEWYAKIRELDSLTEEYSAVAALILLSNAAHFPNKLIDN